MAEQEPPPLTPEAAAEGHDPTLVSEPTDEQLKEGVPDAESE